MTLLPQTACHIWNTNPVHLYIYIHTDIVFVFILFGFTQVARLRPFFCIGAHFHHRFRVFVYLFFHTASTIYIFFRSFFFCTRFYLFTRSSFLKKWKQSFIFFFDFIVTNLFIFFLYFLKKKKGFYTGCSDCCWRLYFSVHLIAI